MTTYQNRLDNLARRELVDGRLVATQVPDERHGTLTIYTNYGCRCIPCTVANRAKQFEQREYRFSRRVLINGRMVAVEAPTHGRNTYSNWGCRCEVCTDDWAVKHRRG